MPTKKETILDSVPPDCNGITSMSGDNLKRAMDFISDLEHKIVTCHSADDLLSCVANESPNRAVELTTKDDHL